jgi:flagellar biosynthesis component FlhA
VTPIRLALSSVLVPFVDPQQDGGRFLYELIPAMRDRIKAEFGVHLPGVRARAEPAFPAGSYEVEIAEVPAHRGHLMVDRWFLAGPTRKFSTLNILEQGIVSVHPVTGEPGCWLDEAGRSVAEAAGETTFATPELLVDCIASVLRANLARLFSIQEAANWIEQCAKEAGGREQVEAALPTSLARYRFTWLLKGLLAERVPISDWMAILASAKDMDMERSARPAMIRAARLRLRQTLPGNVGTQRVPLPPHIEAQFLTESGDGALSSEPDTKRLVFWRWLHDQVERYGQEVVLVTHSPAVRPYLRRLIATRLPEIMVLAEEELLGFGEGGAAQSAGEQDSRA